MGSDGEAGQAPVVLLAPRKKAAPESRLTILRAWTAGSGCLALLQALGGTKAQEAGAEQHQGGG